MKDIVKVSNLWTPGHSAVVANIILNYNIKKMAEIGVYKGENMRTILRSKASEVLTEYVGIDPWEVNDDHWRNAGIETWDNMYQNVVKYMPWFKQLKLIKLHSENAAKWYMDGYFDMVYIDGDHHYESVLKDIKTWLPKIRKGGIIAGHDFVEDREKIPEMYGRKCATEERKNYLMGPSKAVIEMFGNDFIKERCSVWYKILD